MFHSKRLFHVNYMPYAHFEIYPTAMPIDYIFNIDFNKIYIHLNKPNGYTEHRINQLL